MAELMIFYCEQAVGFGQDVGMDDEPYLNALVSMFEQVLMLMPTLEAGQRDALLPRLEALVSDSADFGYLVGGDMEVLLEQYAVSPEPDTARCSQT